MRRCLMFSVSLIAIFGLLSADPAEACRHRSARRCRKSERYCYEPIHCLVDDPYFCNGGIMMQGNPVTYFGNRYPDGSYCGNQTLTLCTGGASACGTYPQSCSGSVTPKAAGCVAASHDPSDTFVFLSPDEGNQLVQSGRGLESGHDNSHVDAKINDVTRLGYQVRFNGYWRDENNRHFRLLKISDRSRPPMRSFYIGFQVQSAPAQTLPEIPNGEMPDVQPVPTTRTADWTRIRVVPYSGTTYSEIVDKTFVVILLQ